MPKEKNSYDIKWQIEQKIDNELYDKLFKNKKTINPGGTPRRNGLLPIHIKIANKPLESISTEELYKLDNKSKYQAWLIALICNKKERNESLTIFFNKLKISSVKAFQYIAASGHLDLLNYFIDNRLIDGYAIVADDQYAFRIAKNAGHKAITARLEKAYNEVPDYYKTKSAPDNVISQAPNVILNIIASNLSITERPSFSSISKRFNSIEKQQPSKYYLSKLKKHFPYHEARIREEAKKGKLANYKLLYKKLYTEAYKNKRIGLIFTAVKEENLSHLKKYNLQPKEIIELHEQGVKSLLENNKLLLIELAAKLKNQSIMDYLYQVYPNDKTIETLRAAICLNQTKVVTKTLKGNISSYEDEDLFTPPVMLLAQLEMFKLIFNRTVDPMLQKLNQTKQTFFLNFLFNNACSFNRSDIAKYLFTKVADVNSHTETLHEIPIFPLYAAARTGSSELINFLLEEKADVNLQKSDTNETALHAAAKNGHYEIVKILLRKGADSSLRDNSGLTARQVAQKNNPKMALLLGLHEYIKQNELISVKKNGLFDSSVCKNRLAVAKALYKVFDSGTSSELKDYSKYQEVINSCKELQNFYNTMLELKLINTNSTPNKEQQVQRRSSI